MPVPHRSSSSSPTLATAQNVDGQSYQSDVRTATGQATIDDNIQSQYETPLPSSTTEDDDDDPFDEAQRRNRTDSRSPKRRPSITVDTRARRFSFTEEDETNTIDPATPAGHGDDDEKAVTWVSLPKKGQLAILTFARLSEPITLTSLQSYMFYQLKSFDPSLPDSTISSQAGMMQACFTAAQFLTAVIWGRVADTDFMGRKRVLLVGLSGTCIACVGIGFSRSFITAAIFRTLGGVLNSNVGVMRTMIAEIIEEKKYQSRAFLLLPMCFNIGVIIGPMIGGSLADPVTSYPGIFGPGSWIGGKDGVWWMQRWPYALPNLFSAVFISCSLAAVFFGLEETHEIARYRSDWGRKIASSISRYIRFSQRSHKYRQLDGTYEPDTVGSIDPEGSTFSLSNPTSPAHHQTSFRRRKRLPFREIWTPNVLLTLASQFLLAFHISAFNALCFVFMPTPRADESTRQGWFRFGGGLGMPSSQVGLAAAIIGVIGLPLQILVYPRVQFRLGTLKSLRTFLPFSPLAYLIAPFLVIVPRYAYLVWPALAVVFALQVLSRTFALPAGIILINNTIPDPSVLGTVHGVAQSVTSGARTIGPMTVGWGHGMGLKHNFAIGVWWALAVEALLGWLITWKMREGSGFERKKTAATSPTSSVRGSGDQARNHERNANNDDDDGDNDERTRR
ncbi:hypothetical protein AJ80_07781 [Polytolypa hystricis UAMH7299]|uniref:Major facilitator superfamily (MFS) profile domain-containing protein n=1 Tax=Polytolypa hystricis (strain UAMH7299) TaxID=1447883 RepID=A0A2B7XJ02_POLH7|nr:hypothetical protein AJ80_07781 [Polytolypa hystricis UAMH7299]